MKSVQSTQSELVGKKLLSLLVVTGLAFSGISFFMLDGGFPVISSNTMEQAISSELCENGLCYTTKDSKPIVSYVQQGQNLASESIVVSKTEIFTDLKFVKPVPTRDYTLSGNKATLFAEKDSFIREGIKNTNEGSNEIIRVMGTGPTNNRALISFSQADIESVASGKNLESATLKLYIESTDGKWEAGQLLNIHQLVALWAEGTGMSAPMNNLIGTGNGVTWNCSTDAATCSAKWNGGNFEEIPTDSVFISNHVQSGYWIKFDVTQDVKDYLSGSPNYGWLIMKSVEDASGRINFAAREAQSNIPELVMVISK